MDNFQEPSDYVTGQSNDMPCRKSRAQEESRHRMRNILFALFFSFLFSFIAGEVVYRFTGRYRSPSNPIVCERPEFFQQFEPYGYRLWPSRSTQYIYPRNNPRKLSAVSNSDGFRSSREFVEADDRLRILVLGDSFVFGSGVEESERFTNCIEAMQPKWRVDSLGMTGYGPDLMLRALEEVGLRLNPDIVVLCMYTDDFRRVRPKYVGVGYKIPRFQLVSNQLVSIPYPKVRLWDYSGFFQGICHAYWRYTTAEFKLNRAILDCFLTLGEMHGFDVVVIFIPGTHDTKWDKLRRAWLLQYSREHSVPFLDLSDAIHTAAAKKELYLPRNTHWNSEGHRIAATEIGRFLASDVIKDNGP